LLELACFYCAKIKQFSAVQSVSDPISCSYDNYLPELVQGNGSDCAKTVEGLLDEGVGLRDLYVNLFQRSLYEVGSLWERGQISVATEHVATAITERLMTLAYPRMFAHDRCGRVAVISSVANEFHQVGGKMVADLLEVRGWDAYFLGANMPTLDLLKLIDEKKPHLVGLSLSVCFNASRLLEAIETIRGRWPELPILIGGQAVRQVGPEITDRFPHITCVHSLNELDDLLLKEWA
jgi:methanogenic corrinoid protein MtbC1